MTLKINHHPDDATLMSFAAGSLPEALSAVVSAHLDMCEHCRQETRRLTLLGSAMFGALDDAPLSRPAPVMALRSLEAEVSGGGRQIDRDVRRSASATTRTEVPNSLRHLIGDDLDALNWRRLGIGVWYVPLKLSDGATGDLRLLKVAKGRAMPEHSHGGSELTLMLRGAYHDEIGRFAVGDVADLDDDVQHRPIVDPDQDCICLVASEQKARFTGLIPRLVQPLTGM